MKRIIIKSYVELFNVFKCALRLILIVLTLTMLNLILL